MAGFGDNVLPEGLSINKPPGFNGENLHLLETKNENIL